MKDIGSTDCYILEQKEIYYIGSYFIILWKKDKGRSIFTVEVQNWIKYVVYQSFFITDN